MSYVAPGLHLLIDLWNCENLQNSSIIEQAMRDAATVCGATVLSVNLHNFGADAGITGVAILAESHISIHTWQETGYAAIDVFMCGNCNPKLSVPIFEAAFNTKNIKVSEHKRGG